MPQNDEDVYRFLLSFLVRGQQCINQHHAVCERAVFTERDEARAVARRQRLREGMIGGEY